MSDFGLFEAAEHSEGEQRLAQTEQVKVIDRAIHAVREHFPYILSAKDRTDYDDRVALVKNDMLKVVAEHLMPVPSVMRKVEAACRPDFKTADTKVDPQHLPDHFDDEGGRTDLEPTPEDTSPRDASRKTAGRFDTIRDIATGNGHQTIDGMIVDQVTANLLLQVWEKAGDKARGIMETAPLEKVVGIAWKLTSSRKTAAQGDWVINGDSAQFSNSTLSLSIDFDPMFASNFDSDGRWLVTVKDDAQPYSTVSLPLKGSPQSIYDAIPLAEERVIREVEHNPFTASRKTADQDDKNKVKPLIPRKDWSGYLRERAKDGNKVRKNNFTKASREAAAAVDFPDLYPVKTANPNRVYELFEGVAGLGLTGDVAEAVDIARLNAEKGNWSEAENQLDWALEKVDPGSRAYRLVENLYLYVCDAADGILSRKTAQEDPKEVNPEPSGSDAYHRSEDMESLDPDKVETQPKDASRKAARMGWKGTGTDLDTIPDPSTGLGGSVGQLYESPLYFGLVHKNNREFLWEGNEFRTLEDAMMGVESVLRSMGVTVASRRKTAGYNASNWRSYAEGQGALHGEEYEVVADYEDALYPSENPSAVVVVDNFDGYMGEVYDGSGGLVDSKEFFGVDEAKAWADRLLEKTYKGEARGDKGQGKFFTTPGKGRLFSRQAASDDEISKAWDRNTEKFDRGEISSEEYENEVRRINEKRQKLVNDHASSRRRADTKVDPTPLQSDFDDEGGRTNLDTAGEATNPKDAALHAAWAKASKRGMSLADFAAFHDVPVSVARKVARRPFVRSHSRVADHGDAYATSPLVDDVEDLDNHAVIEHFAGYGDGPDYDTGVGVTDAEWAAWADSQLLDGPGDNYKMYDEWVTDYYGGASSRDAFTDWVSNVYGRDFPTPEAQDALSRAWEQHYGGKTAKKRTASSPVPRSANGGIHRVSGWDWDNRQSAYIAHSGVTDFDCTCGRKIATPSFKTCECGKLWNSHTVATTSGTKTFCREVPRRDALLARKS